MRRNLILEKEFVIRKFVTVIRMVAIFILIMAIIPIIFFAKYSLMNGILIALFPLVMSLFLFGFASKPNKNLEIVDFFKINKPILYSRVPFYSKKDVSENGMCTHHIKITIDVPNYGPLEIERDIKTPMSVIEAVDVLVSPNNTEVIYVTDGIIPEESYNDFINTYHNKTEV